MNQRKIIFIGLFITIVCYAFFTLYYEENTSILQSNYQRKRLKLRKVRLRKRRVRKNKLKKKPGRKTRLRKRRLRKIRTKKREKIVPPLSLYKNEF